MKTSLIAGNPRMTTNYNVVGNYKRECLKIVANETISSKATLKCGMFNGQSKDVPSSDGEMGRLCKTERDMVCSLRRRRAGKILALNQRLNANTRLKIARADLLKNKGDAAKLNLLRTKSMIAQEQMTDKWGKGLFSDGTAATGALTTKQFDGLGAVLSASSTYAGIAVADVATWIAQVNENSSILRPLTLNLIQKVDGLCTIDSKKPTVRVANQAVYDQAWSLFTPHQRLVSEEMSKLGFSNTLEINGVPLIVDSHADASTMYFLNEEHLYMVAHPEENMRIEEFDKLEAFNGIMNKIFFMGNLVCEARRLQGVLKDIKI